MFSMGGYLTIYNYFKYKGFTNFMFQYDKIIIDQDQVMFIPQLPVLGVSVL